MGRVKRDIKRGKFSDERSYLVGLGAEGGLTTNDEGDIFIKDMLQ
jgi:hypothetical protein